MIADVYTPQIYNGFYIVTNEDTDEYKHFRIKRAKRGKLIGQRVVAIFDPDNDTHYHGFGFVDKRGIHVWNNKCSRGRSKHQWYAIMLRQLISTGEFISPKGHRYSIQQQVCCSFCNDVLHHPISVKMGVCLKCTS